MNSKTVYRLKVGVFNNQVSIKAGTEVVKVSSSMKELVAHSHVCDRNFNVVFQVDNSKLEPCDNPVGDWLAFGIVKKALDTNGYIAYDLNHHERQTQSHR